MALGVAARIALVPKNRRVRAHQDTRVANSIDAEYARQLPWV